MPGRLRTGPSRRRAGSACCKPNATCVIGTSTLRKRLYQLALPGHADMKCSAKLMPRPEAIVGDQQRAPENGLISPAGDQARTGAAAGASRRRLLQASLVAGAGASLGACRNGVNAAPRPVLRQPGSRPDPRLPAGTDTLPQIKHIVVLTMENHSYDNHLGMLQRPGADGFKLGSNGKPLAVNPYSDGRLQHAFRMPTTCQLPLKPNQTWTNTHIQLDGGKLDGFVNSGSGPVSMGYWQRADLPFYYSLASVFPIADRYFCSVLGQTFPNRRYLMAATSIGQVNDTTPALTDYPANGTIFDRLDAHCLSWKDYFTNLATPELFPPLFLKNQGTKIVPIAGFFTDAAAGTLPGFCLVEPEYGTRSERDPQNTPRH